ncbi:MAG: CoA-binding protein [Alphaproteobacteria bacterium]|nr:CoA-binding protein [Alphaproteobacteria bacterium]
MSDIQADIEDFLRCKRIAVVGLSTHQSDFSCAILQRFEEAGTEVYGVNPGFEPDPDAHHYAKLADIPGEPVEAVFLTTTPAVSAEVVRECAALGIRRVWMHQGMGAGSVSPDAVAFCRENGIAVIDRGCPMMFVEPVDWFHKAFRWCKGLHAVEG